MKETIALDRASIRTVDADGHLHVGLTPISKAVVNPYFGREIPGWQELGLQPDRTYRLLRDPVELEKAAATFDGKPLLFGHKPVTADDHDHDMTVGSVKNPVWKPPYLMAELDVWSGPAIKAIEAGEQRELSSAYRYTPVMEPGTHEGIRYDGRMVGISANHVALVPEGRAGRDVVVGDRAIPQLKDVFMPAKAVPSRAAATAHGALMIHLRSKLAQDAKIDLGSILKGVTAKNFKERQPTILAGVKKAVSGKLAQDADVEDVAEVLEALAPILEAEAAEPEEPVSNDADAELRAALKAKGLSDDEIARICAMTPGATDEKGDKKDDGKKDGKAMDEKLKDMVSKTAMDAAIAAAVDGARKTATQDALKAASAIREAERNVRPWVGEIVLAHDSAEGVYRAALKMLNVEGVDDMHPDALPAVLKHQPKPGDQQTLKSKAAPAMDAAAVKEFAERYPTATRIGHA